MKILHISPTYYPAVGGAEVHLREISEALASRGHEVNVLTTNVRSHWDLFPGRYGDLPEMEVINGVRVIRLSPHSHGLDGALDRCVQLKGGWRSVSWLFGRDGMEMLFQYRPMLRMVPLILRSKADIVASMNWYWSLSYHTYLARRLKRFTLVGIPLFHTAQPWCERPIYDRMLASCDAIIVNTSHEGRFAQQRGAARVEVAGVGVNPSEFAERNGSEIRARYGLSMSPVVGFVGRQEKKKGTVRLVEAMQSVWQWNPEVRLVLAGPGSPQEKDLQALVRNLPQSQRERIVNIGTFEAKDKASLFDAFDVFALPSTEESFGMAYLEAWACQKPVIGARIGPTQCVIDEGVDGLLVDPNDPEDLARALVALLSNRDMRDQMGQRGQAKTMALYTWERVVDKVERLYLDLFIDKQQFSQVPARAKPW
jgi:glycosyltransferase involved in cell wall biosynthesis